MNPSKHLKEVSKSWDSFHPEYKRKQTNKGRCQVSWFGVLKYKAIIYPITKDCLTKSPVSFYEKNSGRLGRLRNLTKVSVVLGKIGFAG